MGNESWPPKRIDYTQLPIDEKLELIFGYLYAKYWTWTSINQIENDKGWNLGNEGDHYKLEARLKDSGMVDNRQPSYYMEFKLFSSAYDELSEKENNGSYLTLLKNRALKENRSN